MWLAIIMEDLEQILTGYAQKIGTIVVAGGHNHLSAGVIVNPSQAVACGDVKIVVIARDRFYALILPYLQLVVFRHLAVILERFQPVRLGIGTAEGNIANFEQFRRSEENHVRRIMEDGVDQAAFIEADDLQARFLSLDGAG